MYERMLISIVRLHAIWHDSRNLNSVLIMNLFKKKILKRIKIIFFLIVISIVII